MIRTDRLAVALFVVAPLVGCGGGGGSSDAPDTTPEQDVGTDTLPPPGDTTPPDTGPPFQPADHVPYSPLPSGDGVLLDPVTIVSILTDGDPLGASLTSFADRLPKSAWWTTMATTYALGTPTIVDATGPTIPTATISDVGMHTYVRNLVTAGTIPSPDGNTIYLLYLPPGVTYTSSEGLNAGCAYLAGAHNKYDSMHDAFAFSQRCPGGNLDDVTTTASHEIMESITDPTFHGWAYPPLPTPPWTGDVWSALLGGSLPVEVGDLCDGTQYAEHGFTYTRIWSNDAAAIGDPCVPAIADAYYDVSPEFAWAQVTPGGTVDVALTAWSTGPISDWRIDANEAGASTAKEITATITAPRMGKDFSTPFPIVNNGEVATLHFTAPATAVSGDWAAFVLYTRTLTAHQDSFHERPIGVYVP